MQPNRLGSFFVLWSGQAVSIVGTQAVQFALIWWLAERTGSAGALAATLVGYHFRLLRGRTREGCFKAFRHSGWVGAAVLGGIIASYSPR